MSEPFIYNNKDNHVEQRNELSALLQIQLQELQSVVGTRDEWPMHKNFAGEAEFWMQVHKALLGAAAEFPGRCATLLLLADDPAARKKHLTQLSQLGGQLIHHAHTHHHVEDHHFFPVFQRAFPKLNHHLELLDGDHKILTETLDQLENAIRTIPALQSDKSNQSEVLFKGEELLNTANMLNNLFIRHIADEEEICIPAILQL